MPLCHGFPLRYCVTDPMIEHDGLRKDGQPDKRTQQDSFAYGKVDPVEAGQKGGQTGGQASGSSSGGSSSGEFGHGKVDPAEAGAKGGRS